MKIAELEFQLERSFSESLGDSLAQRFAGYRPRVSLFENGRKKRHNAGDDNWSPKTGEIRITFEVESETDASADAPAATLTSTRNLPAGIDELIRQLDRAESRPGYNFVALKWFRDSVLPAVRPEWSDSETRDHVLRAAIEARIILTSKVPNPKSPEFPVTAVKLNRSLPEVVQILGATDAASTGFHPVSIRGEALSKTILRERR
ncbi:MAG: hypothetical protein JOZ22_07075 [Acidobacteriia bacterium]|nr:hypothetical protein [Terriglobia bacterium]